MQRFSLKSALAISASAAMLAGAMAVPAYGQSSDGVNPEDEIISIGTRRQARSAADTPAPVDVISGFEFSQSAANDVQDLLRTALPSYNVNTQPISDAASIVRPANLRGLSPDNTLVLVNGKRRHRGAVISFLGGGIADGAQGVDVSSIPSIALKQVQVLRDGASSQYGSDAIAGVINIVLKDADEGGSVSYTYGEYDTQMAGSPQLLNTTTDSEGNLSFETGSDREVNDGISRTASANAGFALGDNGFINVSIESRNNEPTNRSGFDAREQYSRDENGNLDSREFDFDRYNHRFGKAAIEDFALFYNLGYEFDNSLSLYSFASYSNRKGNSGGFYRRAKDSRNLTEVYPDGFLPQIDTDVDDYSFAIGLNGETNDWAWDVSTNYGRNDFGLGVSNSLNTSMGVNSPTEFDNGALVYEQYLVNMDASNTLDLGLPDDVFVTIGAEYRHENYQIKAGETVFIEKAALGSFVLGKDSRNSTIRVKRLK